MPRRRSSPRAERPTSRAGVEAAAAAPIDDGRATALLARLRAERIAADAVRAAAEAEAQARETATAPGTRA